MDGHSDGMQDESKNLPGPPRDVPSDVKMAAVFGSVLGQVGWGLVAGGMLFCAFFGLKQTYQDLGRFSGELETVAGTVLGHRVTGASSGGGRNSRGTPVFATRYRFVARDGSSHSGESYATGRYLENGDECRVEYVADDPMVSRITGMRRTVFPTFILFLAILPGVGLVLAVIGTVWGLKGARLLEQGHVAYGRLVDKQATASRVNHRQVYRLTFEFKTREGGVHSVSVRSHKPELLEDDVEEMLLYDATDPSSAVMFDTLPGKPRMDRLGRLTTARSTMHLFVLPVLALVALVFAVWY